MISVKGLKSSKASLDPADRYRLDSGRKPSRLPKILAGVFSALALYLKASLASGAEQPSPGPQQAAPESESAGGSPAVENAAAPPRGRAGQTHSDAPPPAAENRETGTGNGDAPRSSASVRFDTNLSATIARARSSAANNNVSKDSPLESLDIQSLFGTSGDLADAWTPQQPGAMGLPSGGDRNRAPRASRPTYLFDVVSGAAVAIAISELLENVSDEDGDRLTVQNVAVSSGTIEAIEGGFIYRAAVDAPGPVVLTYEVSDGQCLIPMVAEFSVVSNPVMGTEGSDNLIGTAVDDAITGLDGKDMIISMDGNDKIFGGEGDDSLSGGAGNDTIYGGGGNDQIFGGTGHDLLYGGLGDDRLNGEEGHDVLYGEAGSDVLSDGAGADEVYGGAGGDLVLATADNAADIYDGGEGSDMLDYSAVSDAMYINLLQGTASSGQGAADTISGFEGLVLGAGDDHIVIGDTGMYMAGGEGNNTFEFLAPLLSAAPVVLAHQIIDFGVGDLIKTGKFDIFKKPQEVATDLLDALQGGTEGQSTTIRVRYDVRSDGEDTVVEWNHGDEGQITVVTLNGHQSLVWSEYI